MDRTQEFMSFLDLKSLESDEHPQNRFYHDLFLDIKSLKERAESARSYKSMLIIEDEATKLEQKILSILGSIDLNSSEDLTSHFEGIKQILSSQLLKLKRFLTKKKIASQNLAVELEPEKPKSYKQSNKSEMLEQENKKIIENQDYELTKMKLLKIEQVQKAINEHLLVQDERIDSVCAITGSTSKIYEKLSEGEDFSSGSFFRRASTILLLCLSFVLIFLHFFYKNK